MPSIIICWFYNFCRGIPPLLCPDVGWETLYENRRKLYFPAWGEIACSDFKSQTALAEAQRETLSWSIIMGSFIVPKSYYCVEREKKETEKGSCT